MGLLAAVGTVPEEQDREPQPERLEKAPIPSMPEEAAAEAGALPLLPQPASRVSASVAEARMVQNFFIQIFLSES